MARENETASDVAAAATRSGEKVTREATAQAENVSKAASGAFEASGKAAAGAFEDAGRAATGALEASLKGAQDYQAKLVQCFQANAEANLQLAQKLTQTRSPTDFVETMTSHMRDRIGLMTEQAKELAAVSQAATRTAVDALAHPRR
jgi:phasin protein